MWRGSLETGPASEALSLVNSIRSARPGLSDCGIDLRNGKQERFRPLGQEDPPGQFGPSNSTTSTWSPTRPGKELIALLDALTTNFTLVLREAAHFRLLAKTIVPGLKGRHRIWSAACSTARNRTRSRSRCSRSSGRPREQPHSDPGVRSIPSARWTAGVAGPSSGAVQGVSEGVAAAGICCAAPAVRKAGIRVQKRLVRRVIEFRRFNLMETFRPDASPFR